MEVGEFQIWAAVRQVVGLQGQQAPPCSHSPSHPTSHTQLESDTDWAYSMPHTYIYIIYTDTEYILYIY